jgi:hypothetical protein
VRRQSDQGGREQVQRFTHLPATGKGKRPATRSLLETDMKENGWKLQSVPTLMCTVPDYGRDAGTSVSCAAKLPLSPKLVEALPSDAPRGVQLVGTVVESGAAYACFLRTSLHRQQDPVLHKPVSPVGASPPWVLGVVRTLAVGLSTRDCLVLVKKAFKLAQVVPD